MSIRVLLLASVAALATTSVARASDDARERSQSETEALARQDLAKRLKVEEATLAVVETKERTWPDERLGCSGRRGLDEPVPQPGYRIVLEASGRRYPYHANRFGRVLYCEPPRKPIGPIQR